MRTKKNTPKDIHICFKYPYLYRRERRKIIICGSCKCVTPGPTRSFLKQ